MMGITAGWSVAAAERRERPRAVCSRRPRAGIRFHEYRLGPAEAEVTHLPMKRPGRRSATAFIPSR
jgi:hypothetical protein